MTATSHKNYVVVSKLIPKYDITHDIEDKNLSILISVIYDMINGNTAEYYINNQEEAERKCIEKNKFSMKFVKAIDNIPPNPPKSDKGDYNPQ
ncbi:hypothetical protein [Dickeya chrysanthemi]|uniref:hypothetical protein n=1 Tax=Dickeya chrysanthemi TaxID=556 RepID=UPI000532BEAA|nr:hypothetical protein [Dickeya chrysanthemi]